MKLYANVKSERAEKGQGGNEFLEIEICDKSYVISKIKITFNQMNIPIIKYFTLSTSPFIQVKTIEQLNGKK